MHCKSLRVVLIQPPEEGATATLMPHFENGMGSIGYKPPLGILYVASYLQKHTNHVVWVLDAVAKRWNCDRLVREVVGLNPDVVGISAWTDFWYPAHKCGALIKVKLPDTHIVYGGPHVAIYPKETLDNEFVDSIIVGDGEKPFARLVDSLSGKYEKGNITGLYKKGTDTDSCDWRLNIEQNLDTLAMPDRELLPKADYNSVLGKNSLVTTLITSRGCPYQCTFCKLNFQKNVSHSADRVIQEFQNIRSLNIHEVEIYDDTFAWNSSRVRDICNGLITNGIHKSVVWSVRDRVNLADPDLYQLMYRAGCRRIHFGIESGVQSVIDKMKKRITLDQARCAVQHAKKANLTTVTHFMFGNVDESYTDMLETVKFARELSADYAEFAITIPYPGTGMYEYALNSGTFNYDKWREFAITPSPSYQPSVLETKVDLATMTSLLKKSVRSYYFQPGYIWRELLKLKSVNEFRRKARLGLQLANSAYVR